MQNNPLLNNIAFDIVKDKVIEDKTNQNVTEVFNYLTSEILKNNEKSGTPGGEKLRKDDKKDAKKGCCK